jgi:UDPglucose 6-dehydrogenase
VKRPRSRGAASPLAARPEAGKVVRALVDRKQPPGVRQLAVMTKVDAEVQAFDPVAPHTARRVFGDRITFCERQYDALEGADALLVVTEWNEFRHPAFDRLKNSLKTPVVFDGRNIFSPAKLHELGFTSYGIGRR